MTPTIVFTDSGLGGLAVMADFADVLQQAGYGGSVNLVFFNALPAHNQGYNRMPAMEERAAVFNRALLAMRQRHHPHGIVIACNTLSAVYPHTAFAKEDKKTVHSIVSFVQDMIGNWLKDNPTHTLFVLATPATVSSKVYDFNNPRLPNIACGTLASEIETDYRGGTVQRHIQHIMKEIKQNHTDGKPLAFFLACTHYQYVRDQLEKEACSAGIKPETIIDPGMAFARGLAERFMREGNVTSGEKQINLQVESQAEITVSERASIGRLLEKRNPHLNQALKNYISLTRLF